MATDTDTLLRLRRMNLQLTVISIVACLGMGVALVSWFRLRRLSQASPAAQRLEVRGPTGTLELLPDRVVLRDAQGRLRAELSVDPAGSHLVLTDRTGHAAAQLTAATPTEAGADATPLSALALGTDGAPQVTLKPGALTMSDGAADRVNMGYADTASRLALSSPDGKQAAILAAQPGTDPALELRDDSGQAHLRITLGTLPAIDLVDDAHGDGALLAPARLKLGGAADKQKLLTP